MAVRLAQFVSFCLPSFVRLSSLFSIVSDDGEEMGDSQRMDNEDEIRSGERVDDEAQIAHSEGIDDEPNVKHIQFM
jgi:hypothetical protein